MSGAHPSPGAVFLSYAREDTGAARRICDALRAANVEVWFDQSELQGGDAWDQKIRRQIKDCAFFLPVISATTNARREGYFRREWKLAADRTYDLDDELPFLVPVLIDVTAEDTAHVPEKFKEVQWSRVVTADELKKFVDHVAQLVHRADDASALVRLTTVARRKKKSPAFSWAWAAGFGAGAMVLVAVFVVLNSERPGPASPIATPAASTPPPPANPVTALLAQARTLIYDSDATRNDFALAETLIKRATDTAPDSAEVWGLSALLNIAFVWKGYDRENARYIRTQADAEKALRLDPANAEALTALGFRRSLLGDDATSRELFEQARKIAPQNSMIYFGLARSITDIEEKAHFQADMGRQISSSELIYQAANNLRALRKWREVAALYDEAAAVQPFWRIFVGRAQAELHLTADGDRIAEWLKRVPETKREEPRVIVMRYYAAMLRRDGRLALQVLSSTPLELFEDNLFTGPKSFFTAQALALAGREEAAREAWKRAEESLTALGNDQARRAAKSGLLSRSLVAVTQAALGKYAEAEANLARARGSLANRAHAYALMGKTAEAIEALKRPLQLSPQFMVGAKPLLVDPRWDSLRKHPDFPELVRIYAAADGVEVP